jgi:hypothetical protein
VNWRMFLLLYADCFGASLCMMLRCVRAQPAVHVCAGLLCCPGGGSWAVGVLCLQVPLKANLHGSMSALLARCVRCMHDTMISVPFLQALPAAAGPVAGVSAAGHIRSDLPGRVRLARPHCASTPSLVPPDMHAVRGFSLYRVLVALGAPGGTLAELAVVFMSYTNCGKLCKCNR